MAYKAGTLDVELIGYGESALDTINRTATSLRRLSNAINAIAHSSRATASANLDLFFYDLSKSISQIDPTNI